MKLLARVAECSEVTLHRVGPQLEILGACPRFSHCGARSAVGCGTYVGRLPSCPLRASAPGSAHLTGWTARRATRKPLLTLRSSGWSLLRSPDRQFAASSSQLPPRLTRYEPL